MNETWGFALLANGIDDGLPATGYIKLPEILKRIPISKSKWYDGIKKGIFPAPTKKFGVGTAAWDVQDIRALLGSSLLQICNS